MNYKDYIHNPKACPFNNEPCAFKQNGIYNTTKNCLSCTGNKSIDEKRIHRAYNCVIRRYNTIQYYIYDIEHFYILKYVDPFLKCSLYRFYLELSKLKTLPLLSTPEFFFVMNNQTLTCNDRFKEYQRLVNDFITFLNEMTSLLQSLITKCKLPDQSYAQQYIIKRKNFILKYGRYLENNYADMISETYNNLVQDHIVNQGLSYYDLRKYMKRFILSNYKNDRFHINECLLCNIKKTINHVGPIEITMKELEKCNYYGNDICLDMATIVDGFIVSEGKNYQNKCNDDCIQKEGMDDL